MERSITTRGGGPEPALDQALNALFVSELVAPSSPLWVVSGWISDVEVVDNRGGEVLELAPELPVRMVRFVELIEHQVGAGAEVNVLVRQDPWNEHVLRRLEEVRDRSTAGVLRVGRKPDLHEKLVVTDRLQVSGSMNLTHNGRLKNSESVTFTDDRDLLERQRIHLDSRYRGLLS